MNQNRNSNRRRGRGGNRGQGGGNQGNRIDSRARGNAPQLLEKYKKLAHDASLNGDRVQTEYYLQFADHYFRVVADSRAQREEQRSRRDDREEREASFDESDETEDTEDVVRSRGRRSRGDDAAPSDEGTPGIEGEEIDAEERNPFVRQGRGQQRSRGRNRPANGASAQGENGGEDKDDGEGGLDASALPPSIAREEEAQPRSRGRGRRSRPADDGDEETLEAFG